MSLKNYEFGHKMELCVQQYLECVHGWELLTANWHSRYGEIDLILWNPDGKVWVLVEVKATKSEKSVALLERIDKKKIQKLLKTKYFFEKKEKKHLDDAFFITVLWRENHVEFETFPLWAFLEL